MRRFCRSGELTRIAAGFGIISEAREDGSVVQTRKKQQPQSTEPPRSLTMVEIIAPSKLKRSSASHPPIMQIRENPPITQIGENRYVGYVSSYMSPFLPTVNSYFLRSNTNVTTSPLLCLLSCSPMENFTFSFEAIDSSFYGPQLSP